MSFAFWEKKEPKQVQGLHWNHSLLRPHYDCWKEVHYNCIKKAHYPQAHTLTSYNACDQREQHDCARILRGFIKNTVSSFFAHSWSVGPSSKWRVVSSDKKICSKMSLSSRVYALDISMLRGYSNNLVPRVLYLARERTLVATGHVTTCNNELLIRVGLLYYQDMS